MASEQRLDERKTAESARLHREALDVFPGGVSHNTRYADPHPIYIDRTQGSRMYDVDGNEYVDFWNDHGASLLGHAPPSVVDAVAEQVGDGFHYGAPNEAALELGRRIGDFVPSAERVRFCCSGTEATMYAVRLARAHTGRDRILKVEGGWHGGNTDLSVSVSTPYDQPTTAGLPPGAAEHVHAFRLNDRASLEGLLSEHRGEVAAVIIDPRKGGTPPEEEFLGFLEDARDDEGFCLIFDEVVTGFRVSPGSYQARAGVTPDLTTMGKIVGGGMPVGALAGRADLFENARPDTGVAPDERVLAGGGTFAINPTTMAAGLATLDAIEDDPVYEHTESLGERVREGLEAAFEGAGVDAAALGVSSMFNPVFEPEKELKSPGDVATATNSEARREFQRRVLDRGYYFNPGSMGNVSYAHTEEEIDGFVEAAREAVEGMKDDGVI